MPEFSVAKFPSLDDLRRVRENAINAREVFQKAHVALGELHEKARREGEGHHAELTRFAPGIASHNVVKAHVAKAVEGWRKQNEEKFTGYRRQLAEARETVAAAKELFGKRAALLDHFTVTSPERAAAYTNLANAGEMALVNAARAAVATGNAAVAAAVVSVLAQRPASERPISIREVVDAIRHEQIDYAQRILAEAERFTLEGEAAASAVVNAGANTATRIALGLQMRAYEGDGGEEEGGVGAGLDAGTAKIARGLLARKGGGRPAATSGEAQEGATDAA